MSASEATSLLFEAAKFLNFEKTSTFWQLVTQSRALLENFLRPFGAIKQELLSFPFTIAEKLPVKVLLSSEG